MCRFFVPLWLVLGVLLLGGCGVAWKFGYTFPTTFSLEAHADTAITPSSSWTLTPPVASTSTPNTVPTPTPSVRSTECP